jgi:O-antigen/teichoic acid export membrane protein
VLLYAGFACEGHYGEGITAMAAIAFVEFAAACVAALLGYGPLVATAALFLCRIGGMGAMYVAMRRRAPWLHFGKPAGHPQVMKRLTGPAFAAAGIQWGTALNLYAMVILVGIVSGPASAAIFATVRTVSRVVLQLTAAIGQAVGPELAKAFGEGNHALVRRIQRRANQAAVWSAAAMIGVFLLFGDAIINLWTQGNVGAEEPLLGLLLIGAGIEAAWLTSGTILFFTNRHQRVGLVYTIASIASLPLTYLMVVAWGVDGAAISLIAVAAVMLVEVLRQSLPAAQETLHGWVGSLVRPASVWQAFVALRAQLPQMRSR